MIKNNITEDKSYAKSTTGYDHRFQECDMVKLLVIYWNISLHTIIVTQFAKSRHNDTFLEIHILASSISLHVLKALFCSNINAVLQIVFNLQG